MQDKTVIQESVMDQMREFVPNLNWPMGTILPPYAMSADLRIIGQWSVRVACTAPLRQRRLVFIGACCLDSASHMASGAPSFLPVQGAPFFCGFRMQCLCSELAIHVHRHRHRPRKMNDHGTRCRRFRASSQRIRGETVRLSQSGHRRAMHR